MTMGHYATVLIPSARRPLAPIALLLFCANLPDFVWLACWLTGIEPTQPASFLNVSFRSIWVDMAWSHSVVSVVLQAALAGAAVHVWKRDLWTTAWSAGLVVAHLAEDLVSGFTHRLLPAKSSATIGLGLYDTDPVLAILVEAAFATACVWWFLHVRADATPKRRVILYAVFVGGSLLFLPNADYSMNQLLGRVSAASAAGAVPREALCVRIPSARSAVSTP